MRLSIKSMTGRCIYTALIVLASTARLYGGTADDRETPWYVPDGIIFQTAGFVGAMCVGAEYQYLRDRFTTDIIYGFVPEGLAGKDLHLLTLKNSIRPLRFSLKRRVEIFPLYVGSSTIYCPHQDTFVRQPEQYPDNYYKPTALHWVFHNGTELVFLKTADQYRYSVYVEVCALWLYIKTYNNNRSVIDPKDILSLALGYKVIF